MTIYLDFEKPIEELERKIEELRSMNSGDLNVDAEVRKLQKKARELRRSIFSKLNSWQKTLIARHPDRPYTLDYIAAISEDFIELHGDRRFSDDPAIVSGLGRIGSVQCVIIGHQKGRGVKERIARNFGQPHPEGYRKAMRLMRLAERFRRPVVTFIDTPGAYPGIGAEERGQAEAIADNLLEMSRLRTPIVSVVIGEGGSGGALALGVSDRMYMLEHSTYSVISPEGCASILWAKEGALDAASYARAAEALQLTAQNLKSFGIIDNILEEPLGGAHHDPQQMAETIGKTVTKAIAELSGQSTEELLENRYARLRRLGSFVQDPKMPRYSAPEPKPSSADDEGFEDDIR